MQAQLTTKRSRKGGERSKAGCKTCRMRHVKCDETKPKCLRCSTTGRQCDGYPVPDPEELWQVMTTKSPTLIIRPRANPAISTDSHPGPYFEFFQNVTAPCLSGMFKYEFWEKTLVRAAQSNDAIWQAVIALGSAHHSLETSGDDTWAVRQYNRAIRSITASDMTSTQSLDVILTVCLLFTCFEVLRRHFSKAFVHVQGGIKILTRHQKAIASGSKIDESSSFMIPLREIFPLFSSLENQLFWLAQPNPQIYLSALPAQDSTDENLLDGSSSKTSMSCFANYDEAWESLDGHWHNIMTLFGLKLEQGIPGDPVNSTLANKQRDELVQAVSEWNTKFTTMNNIKPSSNLPQHEKRKAALLESQYIAGCQTLETMDELNPMCWDRFVAQFERILELSTIVAIEDQRVADEALGGKSQNAAPRSRTTSKPILSLDHGIVPAMLHLVWNCRHASIRHRAISLLEEYPRLEGLWYGQLVARAGRRIDEIEREGETLADAAARNAPPEEIPVHARVTILNVVFKEGTEAELLLVKPKGEGDSTPVMIQELWTW